MSLHGRWQEHLAALQQAGRLRRLAPPAGIDLSSNDYLGYGQRHWPPTEGSRSGMASRLLRGDHALWQQVEQQLAAWLGCESCLVFNSGYAANEGLLGAILEPGDWVASDQFNHASIIDGIRLGKADKFIFRHNDLDHLEEGLRQARGGARFVVTESLFGMEGDRAPLAEMAALAERYGAYLIVDEAHATGCFGPTGAGLVDELGLRQRVLATVHTGGKALGVVGAFVAGSSLLRNVLINRARHLIFTTALPAQLATWWLEMLPLVQGDHAAREALHANARTFRTHLQQAGVSTLGQDYIVPVVIGDDSAAVSLAEKLQLAGYDIRAIRPPTVPQGTSRLRISLQSRHPTGMLATLAEHMASLLASRGA